MILNMPNDLSARAGTEVGRRGGHGLMKKKAGKGRQRFALKRQTTLMADGHTRLLEEEDTEEGPSQAALLNFQRQTTVSSVGSLAMIKKTSQQKRKAFGGGRTATFDATTSNEMKKDIKQVSKDKGLLNKNRLSKSRRGSL